MADRRLSNWLQAYRMYTEGTESPPIFHLWVAMGTIAAAAQRKITMDAGYFTVHTNLFVVLVSPPGRSRKSTALRIGKGVLKGIPDWGAEIYFSTQASSVAALVKQMSSIPTKEHQSLTAFSSELGSLLGVKSVDMTDFLVDIYDCEPDWDKQTVGRGLEKIERPWFNLIGATTPQWMGDNLSRTAIEGGFVSRTIFVFDDTRRRVAFPELTEEQKTIRKALMHDLAQIAKLKGEFKFSPQAKEFYRYWYEEVNLMGHDVDYRISGFYERKHIHVLKVAMALSLAEDDDLTLQQRDIETAIAVLTELEPGMRRAFSAVGKNVYSTDLERIKNQILEAKGLPYKKILAGNIHSVEKDQLDKLLDALITMGEIERGDNHTFYPTNGSKNGQSTSNGKRKLNLSGAKRHGEGSPADNAEGAGSREADAGAPDEAGLPPAGE